MIVKSVYNRVWQKTTYDFGESLNERKAWGSHAIDELSYNSNNTGSEIFILNLLKEPLPRLKYILIDFPSSGFSIGSISNIIKSYSPKPGQGPVWIQTDLYWAFLLHSAHKIHVAGCRRTKIRCSLPASIRTFHLSFIIHNFDQFHLQ